MLKIAIPRPCNQEWNNMEAGHDGRFCHACAKTVVDFTLMNDNEVQNFLLYKKEEKLCGRFTNTQLKKITIMLPENILAVPMPLWKKFLTASLIIFSTTLFSCNTNYDEPKGRISFNSSALNDTIPAKIPFPPVVGKIKMPGAIPVKKICTHTMGIIAQPLKN